MPRGDGTGPFGTGPIGGYCVNQGTMRRGMRAARRAGACGRGFGLGLGMQNGRGWEGRDTDFPVRAADKKELLSREKEILAQRMAEIDKQLDE